MSVRRNGTAAGEVTARPSSPASERNKHPILEVLREEFKDRHRVLEIGSGTGQHAVFFAAELPYLVWQTSDLPENHAAILAWLDDARLDNVEPPLELDVDRFDAASVTADAAFSANTAHIMGTESVESMFSLVGRLLPDGGVFCLYGPFNFDGKYSSESNAAFDASLRQRSPSMGIRDLGWLEQLAENAGMTRERLYAMPANNHVVVWRKGRPDGTGTGRGVPER
jgi:cyclopropane fatty-acyl-phospholipid synthase-like methyltransferase